MKWNSWFKRRRWEQRMDAELRFHLDAQVADYMARGHSRQEAERLARVDFGTVELAKDECRDQRPAEWFEEFLRDIRLSGRALRRNLGFSTAGMATLALGIGANAAVFSVVYAVLLKPLPYREPGQLYAVEVVIPERVAQFASLPVPVQSYLAWRQSQTAFSDIAVLGPWEANLSGDAEPERLGGARVSANFFTVLGVPVTRGRSFSPNEEQPGSEKVVVISDALWRRRYSSDPSIIGRTISINDDSHTVIGVASPSMVVPVEGQLHPIIPFAPHVDIWKPIAPSPRELANESWDHGVLARLRPGQSAELGRRQLQEILNADYRAKVPDFKTELRTQLVPIREIFAGKVRLRLLLVLAAAALLLLTACANLANLFLARAAGRLHEFATRIALGAGQARILRQMLVESTVLSLMGGALGLVVAHYGAAFLATHGPGDVRLLAGAPVNLPVALFAAAASLFTGIACAVIPAWQLSGRDAAAGLKEGARIAGSAASSHWRQILIGAQMALATMLLASAGLLLHSFSKAQTTDRGYAVERVLTVNLSLFGKGQDSAAFYRQLAENVRTLPGVLAAGAINDLPAEAVSTGASRTIFYESDTDFQRVVLKRPVAMVRSVTTGYFAAAGGRVLAGRFFHDSEPMPAAIVSQSLAQRLWPHEAPATVIGRVLRQGNVTGPLIMVVGIMQDIRPGAVDREMPPLIYRPYPQWASGPATLVVRTAQDPAAVAAAVRAEIRKLNPNLPIPTMRTMREIVSAALAERRFQMSMTLLFALVALLLGAVGVYGVVSYSVAGHTRDIGLRIALGATHGHVAAWVLRTGMRPVLLGLAAGLGGAIAIARALRSLLFGISPLDPLSLVSVVLILLAASLLACYLPARRAAHLDPTTALRHE